MEIHPDDLPFYAEATSVYRRTRNGDYSMTHRLVQSFTKQDLAHYYAQVLNRLWKEGKLK